MSAPKISKRKPQMKRFGGRQCVAVGCNMRKGTNLLSQVKLFKFPKDPIRNKAWTIAMRRKDWIPNKLSEICNVHFVTGMPSTDPEHPDYIPSIFSFNPKSAEKAKKRLQIYENNIRSGAIGSGTSSGFLLPPESISEDEYLNDPFYNELKKIFFDYFSLGLRPAESLQLHKTAILAKGDLVEEHFINRQHTAKMVDALYSIWKKLYEGSSTNYFMKMKENRSHYAEKGADVFRCPSFPFSVLIVTALMKRAQELKSSKEAIFIDTIYLDCGCAAFLTTMFTVTKIGAVPIAAMLHQDQTKNNYRQAFTLLKDNFPFCFGNEQNPLCFVTEDDIDMKSALFNVWPCVTQYLSHYYMGIAQWKYLWTKISVEEKRPELFKLFEKVMFATTEKELDDFVKELFAETVNYPEFIQGIKMLLNRKCEWVYLYRLDILKKNGDLSKYAEFTIRAFKNVLLGFSSFSPTAIVELFVLAIDTHIGEYLSSTVQNGINESDFLYSSLAEWGNKVLKCINSNDESYLIESESNSNLYFSVNKRIGVCTCGRGRTGALCIHQVMQSDDNKLHYPVAPVMTQADKYDLGILILGNKIPLSLFLLNEEEMDSYDEACNNISGTSNIVQKIPSNPKECTVVKENEIVLRPKEVTTGNVKENLKKGDYAIGKNSLMAVGRKKAGGIIQEICSGSSKGGNEKNISVSMLKKDISSTIHKTVSNSNYCANENKTLFSVLKKGTAGNVTQRPSASKDSET